MGSDIQQSSKQPWLDALDSFDVSRASMFSKDMWRPYFKRLRQYVSRILHLRLLGVGHLQGKSISVFNAATDCSLLSLIVFVVSAVWPIKF